MEDMNKSPNIVNRQPIKDNVHFISSFENYDKEVSGLKRNTVRIEGRQDWLWDKLNEWRMLNNYGTVTIQKGYTKKCFTRQITDITCHEGVWIISW